MISVFSQESNRNLVGQVKIIFRKKNNNIVEGGIKMQIDVAITPLYCHNCNNQLEHLYLLSGSRYGQVGTVSCSCGAQIICTDDDNIVQFIDTTTIFENEEKGRLRIDFQIDYKLNQFTFETIKQKFALDLFSEYENQTIDLAVIIGKLENILNIRTPVTYQPPHLLFKTFPEVIKRWIYLLELAPKVDFT